MENFSKVLCEMEQLYGAKNNDYGNSFTKSFEKYGLISPLIRLEDKLNRLESLVLNGSQEVENESIRDTLVDLANYAAMTIVELDKKSEEARKAKYNI